MLKHEDNSQIPSQPTSQASTVSEARVTPEELTQALAAIEARRQAEASRLAGTIPLGQAVSELHLDSTTDEIWTEVQAQRAKAAEAKPAAAQRQQIHQPQAIQQVSPTPSRTISRRWIGVATPFLIVWVLFQTSLMPHFGNTHSLTSTSAISTAPPVLSSFALIPDGKEVYADDASLMQISEGKPLSKITVSVNHTQNRWTLVKTSGHVYLRGYIASSDSLQPLQGKALNVYNDDNSGELHGETTSNITLRVDNVPLQKSSGDDDFSGITVSNFQPDPLTTLTPWH